jgi:hypothetical protein
VVVTLLGAANRTTVVPHLSHDVVPASSGALCRRPEPHGQLEILLASRIAAIWTRSENVEYGGQKSVDLGHRCPARKSRTIDATVAGL